MINKNSKIWIWIQNNRLFKAIYNQDDKSLIIYNENDEVLVKRKGLNQSQIKKLEVVFLKMGAKRMDGHERPFTYL